jgi:hypothetical protein
MPTPDRFYNYKSRVFHFHPNTGSKGVKETKYMVDSIHGILILQKNAINVISNV